MSAVDQLELGHTDELTIIFPRRRLSSDTSLECRSPPAKQPWSRQTTVASLLVMAMLIATFVIVTWSGMYRRAPVSVVKEIYPEEKNELFNPGKLVTFVQNIADPAQQVLSGPNTPSYNSPSFSTTHLGRSSASPNAQQAVESNSLGSCWMEYYTNYLGNDLRSKPNVNNAALCCQECANEPRCLAWSWGKSVCYLKGSAPRQQITKVRDLSMTSGQPTQLQRSITAITAIPGQSLFCFALMLPFGYEKALLSWQYSLGYNLFGCDEYAVYSNMTMEVAPGVNSIPVASTLKCSKGGEFGTALNTEIFLAVWARVVADGRFKVHDWTVKVDPDCVFFPVRLRSILPRHPEGPGGVYLNNCERGMHGPLEVFSRTAVSIWWQGAPRCQQHFNKLCSGDCQWGEDMFIDQCLMKVLNVKREFEKQLLVEDHCDPPPDWMSCKDTSMVAFHPFKTPDRYKACMDNVR